jgi:hypothetical protein
MFMDSMIAVPRHQKLVAMAAGRVADKLEVSNEVGVSESRASSQWRIQLSTLPPTPRPSRFPSHGPSKAGPPGHRLTVPARYTGTLNRPRLRAES